MTRHVSDVHTVDDRIDISPEFSFDHLLQCVLYPIGNLVILM
jgi:hypothetical protein